MGGVSARPGWRLGVPFLISIFVLMPIAYYPTSCATICRDDDFSFLHFWRNIFVVGPWPSGPAWFLWVLLALDAVAATVRCFAPGIVKSLSRIVYFARTRPIAVFAGFLAITIAAYEPLRLTFGDASWLEIGALPLPIQTSRILLYTAYFFAGVIVGATNLKTGLLAEDGELAKRWPIWLAVAAAFYGAILALVTCITTGCRISTFRRCRGASAMALLSPSTAARCALPSRRFSFASRKPIGTARRDATVGLRHLFVALHFIVWLQYAVYDLPLHVGVKFAIVFIGTFSMSWILTMILRKIPFVARMV